MTLALAEARVLVVGVGGLGCPAASLLARAGVGQLTLCDDDVVDESNLHRQTLYRSEDEGQLKVELAKERLRTQAAKAGHACDVIARAERVLPDTALGLVAGHDLVLEGADNFATKFLVADACALVGVPVVQAGAVRWVGWTLASAPRQSACLRCVFEDVPRDRQDTCASAGVVGAVVGVIGALQAALALRLLSGDPDAPGTMFSYDGLRGGLRQRSQARQRHCQLCNGGITDTDISRYVPPQQDAHTGGERMSSSAVEQ
jgi:adenylyltransferase/sulfurtransferase